MAGPHAGNRNRPAYSGQSRFRFPKQIIELFAPRPPLKFKPPVRRNRLPPMTGLAAYVNRFNKLPPVESKTEKSNDTGKKSDDNEGDEENEKKKEVKPFETPAKRRARKKSAQKTAKQAKIAGAIKSWDPFRDKERKTRDPRRTLFVSGFARDTPLARLRSEFETYGRVVQVIIPKNLDGVPCGYAFVEFERDAGLKSAYDGARGRKIDGRKIIVDVERARTTDGWRPNRLDGPNNVAAHPPPPRRPQLPPQRVDSQKSNIMPQHRGMSRRRFEY